jgi:putative cardiolipin synthase
MQAKPGLFLTFGQAPPAPRHAGSVVRARAALHRAAATALMLLLTAWLAACGSLPVDVERDEPPPLAAGGNAGPSRLQQLADAQRPGPDSPPGASAFAVLEDGTQALGTRLALIRQAGQRLDIQTYIWADDTTGRLLMRELLRAADRGVRVRLLLDDNNTVGLDPWLRLLDAHPHIAVRLFNPFPTRVLRMADWVTDFRRVNRRMHNKLMLADDRLAVLGGRNIGDTYFGTDRELHFEDTELLVLGPVLAEARASFERYWNSPQAYSLERLLAPETASRSALDRSVRERLATLTGQPWRQEWRDTLLNRALAGQPLPLTWAPMELLDDPPVKVARDPAASAGALLPRLGQLFGQARESLDLVSAYFVPGDEGTEALATLARAGVQVRLLTNSLAATDVAAAHVGYARHRLPLAQAGVHLLELKPTTSARLVKQRPQLAGSRASLHAKAFAVDGQTVFIGSLNLDPRSTRLNTEVGLLVHSPALAQQLHRRLDDLAGDSAWWVHTDAQGTLVWADAMPAQPREGSSLAGAHSATGEEPGPEPDPEPGASLGRRLSVWLLSWFDLDWLL